ncbi:AAA family ATPase [Corynebacterium stationis]|uniref:AAA family ATPase n=1 Tax=Corynebacterium stationis TaxID=1705 RepID=UPI0009C35FC3|nr:AAA family ATPase [Corynebacterium stationis]AQX70124.1 AAA family ATPase [Corynebacterium stationis]ASJ17828.1 AAA family ATPase [Corynebacterium stationis]HJG64021.1 ATP-binding protein [Corynebacterium stationis]
MLIVVTGAPAAGKSTWVNTVAKPGDIRFDSDALTRLLTGKQPGKHHHDSARKKVSQAARQAGIDAALPLSASHDVYVIHSNLDKQLEAKYRSFGARFVVIDPGEEVNLARCKAGRPGYKQRLVAAWYKRRHEWPAGAEIIRDFVPVDAEHLDDAGEAESLQGAGMLHVVIGPPAAGKSTFVKRHSKSGDIVIDFDLIANALSGRASDNHQHEQMTKTVATAARKAALAKALDKGATVWMIHSSPSASTLAEYEARPNTEVHVIDPGKDVVMSRCKSERPATMLKVAAAWYDQHAKQSKPARLLTTTERGLGWEHQKNRDGLMAVHVDGTPCWWCGKPMYREPALNHDGKSLAADHGHARHYGGTKANQLLHFTCNSSRKQGDNDDKRPALQVLGDQASGYVPPAAVPASPSASFGEDSEEDVALAEVFAWPSM